VASDISHRHQPAELKGSRFLQSLTDELLASGIEPFATLYHWDLPQALQDKNGGWLSSDIAKAFADYSGYVAEKLSDRIKHFSRSMSSFWLPMRATGGSWCLAAGP
jgi:beta-glucosidase/6-phospho-beta-glucosidase/beta-galactosidase